jgi:hypothetical protein
MVFTSLKFKGITVLFTVPVFTGKELNDKQAAIIPWGHSFKSIKK